MSLTMVNSKTARFEDLIPRKKVKFKKMGKESHMAKITEPTNCLNSMVVIVKVDKICICIDLKDLNKAIGHEHHPTPMVEEVIASMPKAKVFSMPNQVFYK